MVKIQALVEVSVEVDEYNAAGCDPSQAAQNALGSAGAVVIEAEEIDAPD